MDIVSKGDTPTAQVIYVDFGNHESLPVSRLRMLRKEHAELPMMAALCALEGMVSPDGVRYYCTNIIIIINNKLKGWCKMGISEVLPKISSFLKFPLVWL